MVATKPRRESSSEQLLELRGWYEQHPRPLVVRAARDGTISPAQAVTLEREMRDLLETSGRRPTAEGE